VVDVVKRSDTNYPLKSLISRDSISSSGLVFATSLDTTSTFNTTSPHDVSSIQVYKSFSILQVLTTYQVFKSTSPFQCYKSSRRIKYSSLNLLKASPYVSSRPLGFRIQESSLSIKPVLESSPSLLPKVLQAGGIWYSIRSRIFKFQALSPTELFQPEFPSRYPNFSLKSQVTF